MMMSRASESVSVGVVASVALLLLAVGASGQFVYDVHVQTGAGFAPQFGNMFVLARSAQHANNISMSYQAQQIVPSYNYVSAAQSPIPAPQLSACSFQWVNRGPAQAIRVHRVSLVPKYLQEPYRSQFTKSFCANGILFPNYVVPLYRC